MDCSAADGTNKNAFGHQLKHSEQGWIHETKYARLQCPKNGKNKIQADYVDILYTFLLWFKMLAAKLHFRGVYKQNKMTIQSVT